MSFCESVSIPFVAMTIRAPFGMSAAMLSVTLRRNADGGTSSEQA